MYKYSQRLLWDAPRNSLTESIEAKRSAGEPLVDLTLSNPTEAFANYPHAAIADAYCQTSDFSYKPEPFGQEQARCAVVDLYWRRGVTISSENLALTASTSEAYSLLFQLFGDPGSEILAPVPSYPLFEYLASLTSVRIVPYRLTYDGAWFIDFANLQKQINQRTRAIVIVNPNNPTGSFLKTHEAERLFAIARQQQVPIISDEVFFDYPLADSAGRVRTLIGSDSVLSLSLDGLSKTAAMPQMKLGWIAIDGPPEQVQVAQRRLELLLDTYLSVSMPVQSALPLLLKIGVDFQHDVLGRAKRNLASVRHQLEKSPAHVVHVEGGWSAIVQLPRTQAEESWVNQLLEEGVVVQPGYFFDMASEAYIVVSLITPPGDFDEGIRRLRTLVTGLADNLQEVKG